jgi:AcrR family transcriptional regulator
MAIADRKLREKENLKSLILQGAKKLFVERGIEQTTIRNIADEIDYSIGTVYVYFKDKNAILYDLHSEGFTQLGGNFRELYTISDPIERLKVMGRIYIKFALENAEMYDLMFNLKAPMEFLESRNAEEWNEGKATFDVLNTTVKQCIEEGHFKEHSLEPLSFMIWSMVHGMCSLEIRQRSKGVNLINPDTIVMESYNEFLKMIDKM